jgi:hypothetical protein
VFLGGLQVNPVYKDLPLVSCLKCLLENGLFACLRDVS